ncbi:diguanylate cyclase [Marinobacter salinisoli]|uniref:diguanylate cyclase n=1 Tax=Marinobacter salinisoli TaxID=2769486 RepID=A0ABX7MUP2_9GAMM|nr:GGDEF domain-containing protein [Marinobacter salinisoli]QSP95884.1 diguanylate cyclase [Marinobacter salinisoli]
MASDVSWKEKYFKELESAETRHKQWQDERSLLQRMLVRTSLASEGQTPELDALLAKLRKDLKKKHFDVAGWRQLQEQIDRQVARLDDQPPAAPNRTPAETTPVAPRQRSQVPHDASTPATTTAGVPGDSQDLADHAQRLRLARRVGELLDYMLDRVSLDDQAERQARSLQQSLLTSENWDELREGLNQVAELVIVAMTRSQKEFEAFLKNLDERLALLRSHFTSQSSAQTERLSDSETLEREIRDELERVGQEVRASEDLQQLKVSVSQNLASIGQAVQRFRTRETDRERMLSEQLQAMQEKLAAMEAHSEEVQNQVRRERVRAMTDLLTQLPNREAWQERMTFEFSRWQRYGHPLTIGLVDIDFFKRINDSYGHKAGDKVLQIVARELGERVRATDFVARYGGEEFALLFPETSPEEAQVAVEKLRQHVGRLPFHFRGEPVSITFSAGLTGFAPGDSEESVFERADRALYDAKDAGRNRTVIAPSLQ